MGPKAETLIKAYRARSPGYSPAYLMSAPTTGSFMWSRSIQLAERKSAQPAPVYMYRLDWETPVANGLFKAPHTLEIPLVVDNVELARVLLGEGEQPQKLADQMSSAWIAFRKKPAIRVSPTSRLGRATNRRVARRWCSARRPTS